MCKKEEIIAENIFIFLEWAHRIVIDNPINDMQAKKNGKTASIPAFSLPAIYITIKQMLKTLHTKEIKIVIIS